MSADVPTVPLIRRAMTSDLPRLGRLGALLVEAHHELDSQRFLAPNDRTPANYASFLKTKLEDPDVAMGIFKAFWSFNKKGSIFKNVVCHPFREDSAGNAKIPALHNI